MISTKRLTNLTCRNVGESEIVVSIKPLLVTGEGCSLKLKSSLHKLQYIDVTQSDGCSHDDYYSSFSSPNYAPRGLLVRATGPYSAIIIDMITTDSLLTLRVVGLTLQR